MTAFGPERRLLRDSNMSGVEGRNGHRADIVNRSKMTGSRLPNGALDCDETAGGERNLVGEHLAL